jgi:phage shock protein A
MYNTILERQANDAREDINTIIKELIIEIHELEEANEKLEGKIEDLEDTIEGLKTQVQELEAKLDNSF